MVEKYEINSSTLAIMPIDDQTSKVIENDAELIVKKNTRSIIDDSCKFFGSSYQGRFEGTKSVLGINYKAPILIEESREIIFFPTMSPRLKECHWISLKNVEKYLKNGYMSKIIFKSGKEIDIDISYSSLENQILRSTRLESIIRNRKIA